MAFSSSRATRRPGGKSPSEYLPDGGVKMEKTTGRMLFKLRGWWWLSFGFGFTPHSDFAAPFLDQVSLPKTCSFIFQLNPKESTKLHQNDVPWSRRPGDRGISSKGWHQFTASLMHRLSVRLDLTTWDDLLALKDPPCAVALCSFFLSYIMLYIQLQMTLDSNPIQILMDFVLTWCYELHPIGWVWREINEKANGFPKWLYDML